MKNKLTLRILAFVLLTVLVSSFLCACGSEDKSSYSDIAYEENYITEDSLAPGSSSGSSAGDAQAESIKDTRKIIETIYYSVQTKSFDEFVASLENKALSVGGYIEQSDVSGNSYDDISSRYATYTFRIPSDKVDEFTKTVSENATVTNRTVNTEDVTLEYVDIESRIKALKTEKASLEDLLSKATSTTEIIEIRDMLTDVIYEIESYESQLRTFDNKIDYTTITVDVDEVEHPVVVHEQSTWERIGTNIVDNCRSLWNFLVELFVVVVSALPFLLFIAVIVTVIVLIVKISSKKRKKKRINAQMQNNSVPVYQNPQPPVVNPYQPPQPPVQNNNSNK
ncbi:MAG: DUF4349 domain-containing protein [Ruminococcus sp.]|nr:DUF4349 domain-containing protein [Ruminococcus sp.]